MQKIMQIAGITTMLFSAPVYASSGAESVSVGLETIDMPYLNCVAETESSGIPQEEIELIALVTMAEAESESEEGKRLVIDTILNRVDSEYFPDTILDVIYQQDAFESIWNGRVDDCYVDYDIYNLVEEELLSRLNYDVVFFTAGQYGMYGEPLFQVGNHYFCSY